MLRPGRYRSPRIDAFLEDRTMRAFMLAAVFGLSAGAAFAQAGSTTDPSAPPAVNVPAPPKPAVSNAPNSSTTPPAVALSGAASKTTAAPVPGANSFTETEARNRIQSFGYSNVGPLAKDSQSIWRGKATREGRVVDVALDYQGNVVGQ
jgi:hypothetical protein